MLNYFCPDLFIDRVEDIDLTRLKSKGFDTLIFDLDNTLVGWRSKHLAQSVLDWLKKAQDLGFKMCIISNCILKKRVSWFGEMLGIISIPKAVKPRKKAFLKALDILESTFNKTVVIGDQIFTDILGGNRLGLYTILVIPVDKREFFSTIIQRTAEKIILLRLKRKGMLNDVRKKVPGKGFLWKLKRKRAVEGS